MGAGWRPSEATHAKANVILRLIKFVDWPDTAFSNASATFNLCVDRHPRLHRALVDLSTGSEAGSNSRSWRGRDISIVASSVAAEGSVNCHVRVLGAKAAREHKTRLSEEADSDTERATLLISDRRGFLNDGGHVALSVGIDTVRFDINTTRAQRDDLRISAELLGAARTVLR